MKEFIIRVTDPEEIQWYEEEPEIPELVRCEDCRHGEKVNSVYLCGKSRGFGLAHAPDWYCADAVRREENE